MKREEVRHREVFRGLAGGGGRRAEGGGDKPGCSDTLRTLSFHTSHFTLQAQATQPGSSESMALGNPSIALP